MCRNDSTSLIHPERVAVWGALVVIVIPVVLGFAAAEISNRWRFGASQPSAWDWLFEVFPPHGRFLVVEFVDGRYAAGVYADRAMAMTSPQKHGLYLCPEWVVDDAGELIEERPGSAGLLIPNTQDVRWVRMLDPGDDSDG